MGALCRQVSEVTDDCHLPTTCPLEGGLHYIPLSLGWLAAALIMGSGRQESSAMQRSQRAFIQGERMVCSSVLQIQMHALPRHALPTVLHPPCSSHCPPPTMLFPSLRTPGQLGMTAPCSHLSFECFEVPLLQPISQAGMFQRFSRPFR